MRKRIVVDIQEGKKEKSEPSIYSGICKKYGFSNAVDKGKKMSTNDGTVSVTIIESPFQYFVNILGGYSSDIDKLEKISKSMMKVRDLLRDIREELNKE